MLQSSAFTLQDGSQSSHRLLHQIVVWSCSEGVDLSANNCYQLHLSTPSTPPRLAQRADSVPFRRGAARGPPDSQLALKSAGGVFLEDGAHRAHNEGPVVLCNVQV